jgi:membrane protease YdiL (CAAX protease family)
LQARLTALTASLIVGGLWALWHLPLLFNTNSIMSSYPLLPYLLQVIALAVIYTVLFNSTAGSVLIVTLFHAASNTVGPFVGIEQTIVVSLVAVALVLLLGPANLARRPKVILPPETQS